MLDPSCPGPHNSLILRLPPQLSTPSMRSRLSINGLAARRPVSPRRMDEGHRRWVATWANWGQLHGIGRFQTVSVALGARMGRRLLAVNSVDFQAVWLSDPLQRGHELAESECRMTRYGEKISSSANASQPRNALIAWHASLSQSKRCRASKRRDGTNVEKRQHVDDIMPA